MNYVLKYIIHERETNKTVYRILDKATGRMADASQEYMDTYGKI